MSNLHVGKEPMDSGKTEEVEISNQAKGSSEVFEESKESEKPASLTERTDEGLDPRRMGVDDLIIFRAILFAALFRTASDTSEILTSRVWNHVIPII